MEMELSTLQRLIWIGIGGFIGSNTRYWLGVWIASRWESSFPWATFLINVSGSFVLGAVAPILAARVHLPLTEELRFLSTVGFLGAYTTFSTYEFEALTMLRSGEFALGALYIGGSVVAGLIAAGLGLSFGRCFV